MPIILMNYHRSVVSQCPLIAFTMLVTLCYVQPMEITNYQHFQPDFDNSKELIKYNDYGHKTETRNKRTVGFLRELFPCLSQIIDKKIEHVIEIVISSLYPHQPDKNVTNQITVTLPKPSTEIDDDEAIGGLTTTSIGGDDLTMTTPNKRKTNYNSVA